MKRVETAKIHDLRSGDVDYRGTEILVDRLWPRGVKKDSVNLLAHLPKVAPSPELRKWFGHDPDKFEEFSQRYCNELDQQLAELNETQRPHQTNTNAVPRNIDVPDDDLGQLSLLIDTVRTSDTPVVLVYAAKDRTHNHANVLADWLNEHIS
ncbi:hypothetical protein HMPREF0183_0011 [Brevibacterium mcbrellneri ATCC 49030]|uniref:Uncharacterized protein n=1 Tax=Brevibacterium mcbrellneri ATCC 49030 TaxID=585530 RepID=D4YJA1_9MICO|nr:DUF488 family protein [Brevibacterium mcbrellneri]EFG48712.1 hypothetical protein HMPREF0183_0011 [Brevibacterium mcbrellneri ATCC 49030]